MCEVVFITKNEVTRGSFRSLDEAMNAVQGIKGLLAYRCFQVYGTKREKKKKLE